MSIITNCSFLQVSDISFKNAEVQFSVQQIFLNSSVKKIISLKQSQLDKQKDKKKNTNINQLKSLNKYSRNSYQLTQVQGKKPKNQTKKYKLLKASSKIELIEDKLNDSSDKLALTKNNDTMEIYKEYKNLLTGRRQNYMKSNICTNDQTKRQSYEQTKNRPLKTVKKAQKDKNKAKPMKNSMFHDIYSQKHIQTPRKEYDLPCNKIQQNKSDNLRKKNQLSKIRSLEQFSSFNRKLTGSKLFIKSISKLIK